MSALVIIIPGAGENHPSTLERANSLYSEMLSKTGCSRIIALREDSSNETPAGLQEFAESRGISVSTHTIERLDPSGFSGDEDQGTLWSEHMATIISNAGIAYDAPESYDFVIGPGSGWNTSLLAAIHSVIGGRIWASVRTGDGARQAIEVGHQMPDSEDSLSTIAAAGQLLLDWGEVPFESLQLQGLVEGVPPTEGIENTFRKHLGTLVNKRTAEDGEVRFELTAEGRARSMLALAEKWEPLRIKSGPKGMILAARDAQEARETIEVVEYLKEQNAALNFDAYFVVVNKHGSNESELAESSNAINESLSDYLASGDLVTMSGSFVDADKELVNSHYDLLSLLHRLRAEHQDVEWSIETSRFLNPLRSAAILYAFGSGIDTFCLMKNPRKSEGAVFASGLSGEKHRFALPSKENLDRMSEILRTKSIHNAIFTAALAKDAHQAPSEAGTILSAKLGAGELRMYEWNRKNLPSGHPMRWPEKSDQNQKKLMSETRKTGIEKSAFVDTPERDFILTPEGYAAAYLLFSEVVE